MKIHSIASFMNELALMAPRVALEQHAALKKAAQVVEKEAKQEFGVYQGAIGPFAKWEELADSTKLDRAAKGFTENDPLLRTGKLRDSISHEVHGLSAAVGSTEDVMVYQELGTEKIPPRPVLAPALLRKEKQVLKLIGVHTAHAIIGNAPFSPMPTITED